MKNSNENRANVYGLLGHNISYSLSPAIHNHYFASKGIDAVYGLFDIGVEDFDANVRSLITGVKGFNVTVPYKERIIPLLDDIRDEAKKTGSVNLVFNGVGYNTDYMALRKLVEENLVDIKDKECVIYGAGGAARTAAYLFGELGMRLRLINRTTGKAEKLCRELEKKGFNVHFEEFPGKLNASKLTSDCVVNCISSGDVNFPMIEAGYAVDFNYGNKSKNFRNALVQAEKVITGEEILIEQAIYSQKLWNNGEPSYNELAEVFNVK